MIIRCVDVETTGLAPPDAGVCELGWCDVAIEPGAAPVICAPRATLVDPAHPNPPGMSGIHHIVDADVVGAPLIEAAIAEMMLHPADALCAHRAAFERVFIAGTPLPWICTYKAAVTLAPNAPDHKLQTLRYWLRLAVDPALAVPAHRAGADAYICACLLARILAKLTPAQLIEIASSPVVLPRLTFGEHAMKPAEDVPYSYWDWMVNKAKGAWDEDVLHTAKHHLARMRDSRRSRSPV